MAYFLLLLLVIAIVFVSYMYLRPGKSVRGERILITGGGSGIGAGLAKKLAADGAHVILWDINPQGIDAVADAITKQGGRVSTDVVDVSNYDAVMAAAEIVKKRDGPVNILFNNAGVVSGRPFLDLEPAQIKRTLGVNLEAPMWTCKAFVPDMMAANHGHIVTISSAAGVVAVSGLADYCASKYGARGFHHSLRMEFRRQSKTGVHTTLVCPFFIDTGMFDGAQTHSPLLLPLLKTDYVVEKIYRAVRTNRRELDLPRFISLHGIAEQLPGWLYDAMMDFVGVNRSMDHFRGRPGH